MLSLLAYRLHKTVTPVNNSDILLVAEHIPRAVFLQRFILGWAMAALPTILIIAYSHTRGKSPFGCNYCSAASHFQSFTAVFRQFIKSLAPSAERASTLSPLPLYFALFHLSPHISCRASLLVSKPCLLRWTAELEGATTQESDEGALIGSLVTRKRCRRSTLVWYVSRNPWLLPKLDGFRSLSVFSTDRRAISLKTPRLCQFDAGPNYSFRDRSQEESS
jgi:hypothetical protein